MKKIQIFIKEYYVVAGLLLLAMYFTYHIFYSQRGYIHLKEIQKEIDKVSLINSEIKIYKDELNHKVSLLSGKAIDEDMLDEVIRKNLNMAEKTEYVILK